MAVKYRVSATTGEYTDREGNTKKRYVDLGVVMDTKNGGLMLKLEAIPVGWDGCAWLNEPKEREERTGGRNREKQFNPDDDVPFRHLTPARCFDVAIG
jgi:hypothetical protein